MNQFHKYRVFCFKERNTMFDYNCLSLLFITEKVQRLEGELKTLKTLEVTQQQKEKELNEKLKHHIKENQNLKVSLG